MSTSEDNVKVPKLADELEVLKPEVEKVLPAQVTVEKFMRVVYTAIAQTPKLRNADRRSLLTAAIKAAQDGLLPDGREAAFVTFRTKEKFKEDGKQMERWIDKVQYMPMVAGILKKIRQSGELKSISVNVVREGDVFRFWTDDSGEHILHEPLLGSGAREVIAAFARATTLNGGVYTEVMSRFEIEQVRSVSKAKDDGPWVDWFDEMAKKTVVRRMSKRMPMSTDIVRVIQRDDEQYDLSQRTRRASSGTAAAKELLGIAHDKAENQLDAFVVRKTAEPELVERPDNVDEDGVIEHEAASETVKPSSMEDVSKASMEKAADIDALDTVMDSTSALYKASKRKVPEELTAFYRSRREQLQQ